ncbi:DUF5325 family protein [Bacillus kexueae]|uniref:DUF5325 family protein n=1 Tax=Aeribacillus kexueae TaxID=2078952 RepID=UPI001FAEB8DD|nr:DUF5325 family protein [Bacillus kexueae]
MKKEKVVLLLFAFLAAFCMVLIGFAIGAKSLVGIILSIVAVIAVFGFGFSYKKKLREKGLL